LERPYIICHMLTSLDGKIVGDYLKEERTSYFAEKYEKIHDLYGCKAWICGRITMEKHFTFGNKLNLDQDNTPTIPRTDYVANTNAKTYAVAVDPLGKLGWTKNIISDDDDRFGHHIVEVLSEQVSDAYLFHLRKLGISYIFGGKESLNFTVVVEKLKNLFSVATHPEADARFWTEHNGGLGGTSSTVGCLWCISPSCGTALSSSCFAAV
jgi:riboflavin biosynthesis pyrimidine reductase